MEIALNKELLTIMEQVYANYTGQEVAQCIAHIRIRLNRQRERQQLEQDIATLKLRLSQHEDEVDPCGYED
jgi:KaiC/GvpD/RAD55 family RecA-like ATPase